VWILIIESDVRFYKRGVLEKRGEGAIGVKKILGGVAIFKYQDNVGGRGWVGC
jgi:hypothetical protein